MAENAFVVESVFFELFSKHIVKPSKAVVARDVSYC